MRKTYIAFVATFILFELFFSLILLRVLGLTYYYSDNLSLFVSVGATILFLIGIILGLILLLKSDTESLNLTTIKTIYILFYIISPISLLFYSVFTALSAILIIFIPIIWTTYSFDLFWAKGKRIGFFVLHTLMLIISSVMIFLFSAILTTPPLRS